MTLEWSPMQSAVFNWAETGSGSANVIARAGTGKTTLLVELSNRIQGRSFLGAFNKSIATELQSRISARNVLASTMHSLGYSLWRKSHPKCEVDGRKVNFLSRELFPWDKPCAEAVASAVNFAKLAGLGLPGIAKDEVAWTDLIERHDLWDDFPGAVSPARVVESCMKVYDQSLELAKESVSRLDFSDMIFLPLLMNESAPMYDWVMQDEAQDLSETRRRLMYHVLKPGGRIAAVGDPRQAVYQFAGASADSMEKLKADLGSMELPLTVTYRCPRRIVEMAQQWVPDFTAHETAPEGVITNVCHDNFWKRNFDIRDVILCRNTRPLLGIAQRLRGMGIACIVEGSSGKALISLALKWGDLSIQAWLTNLEGYEEREIAKQKAKGNLEKAEYVQEKCDMLRDLADDLGLSATTRDLVRKIDWLFGDDQEHNDRLRLCTIHRYKGREADRVYLIGRNRYQPSKWAKTEEEMTAEDNLKYIAVTRVKKELVEVKVPPAPTRRGEEEIDWWQL